jgi:hypothetical protein
MTAARGIVLRKSAPPALIFRSMLRARAEMSEPKLDFPMSTDPPRTAATVAAPLFERSYTVSMATARKSPAFCAYRTGAMSSAPVPDKRIVTGAAFCAPETAGDITAAIVPAANALRFI